MATMVKEKKREKKKSKEKSTSKQEANIPLHSLKDDSGQVLTTTITDNINIKVENVIENTNDMEPAEHSQASTSQITCEQTNISHNISLISPNIDYKEIANNEQKTGIKSTKQLEVANTYQDLNNRLERVTIPKEIEGFVTEEIEKRLESPIAYIKMDCNSIEQESNLTQEMTVPSAPVFEEEILETVQVQPVARESAPRVQCIALEEAIRLFGGKVISELKILSDREESLVEAGPVSGPEHPLVDLLSTFRSSLIALDRERLQLARGFIEENKFRTSLWKVTKRVATATEKCACDSFVHMKASFEQAEFLTEKVPVARLKLDALLKDLQESYCHYQYAALLAHYQIEQLISELLQANKPEIREALSLILQALRYSDGAPETYALALQRWAGGLAGALVDGRDVSQLLFVLHHLFRQTRSVRWVTHVVHLSCVDLNDAALTIGFLDLLLTKLRLDNAVECTEDSSEVWEEVDKHGSGAVIDGNLRERDLLLLIDKLPLSQLAAKLLLITSQDISPRDIVTSCHGVRCLCDVIRRAVTSHTHYVRLSERLVGVAVDLLEALGCLYEHIRETLLYTSAETQSYISAELEECFCAGFELVGVGNLHRLPATLLSGDAARDYIVTLMTTLHDKYPKQLSTLRIELPPLSCSMRVSIVSQSCIQRAGDNQLASVVLDFLMQTGIKQKSPACKGSCGNTAREYLPKLLEAHPYLHTTAFNILGEMHQVEPLDPSSILHLSPNKWRPHPEELRELLVAWTQRCANLLPALLTELDYTPHTGISLPSQLSIASHLTSLAPTPPWCWALLLRLRAHRACWRGSLDAPPPEASGDTFSDAVALLTSGWGHCVPLICTEGVSALCRVAPPRPLVATHCLNTIMLVMAQAPESLALTDKFAELFNILLTSGPSLMQRALGRGGVSGEDLLLKLILTHVDPERQQNLNTSAIISAWLHALWRPDLPAALSLLDTLMLATRQYHMFDNYAANLLSNSPPLAYIALITRNAHLCPFVCECVLRARMVAELNIHPRLLQEMLKQKERGSVHVDNALLQIKAGLTSEDLVVHRAAACVAAAPPRHPARLALCRLLLHLYLQRPHGSNPETTPPVGPLFFSGFIKSRALAQVKKNLQETATYHRTQSESLKQKQNEKTKPQTKSSKNEKPLKKTVEDEFLSVLSINNLTGESESSSSESEGEEDISEQGVSEMQDHVSLITYHVSAEQMINKYLCWLEEGENTRALPHHADIALFIPSHALEAAWKHALSLRLPSCDETFPLPSPPPPPPPPPPTPLERATKCVMKIAGAKKRRSRVPTIKPCIDNVIQNMAALLHQVDRQLEDIEAVAEDWDADVTKISTLNNKLFDLLPGLRVRRPLPPVNKYCVNKCKPIFLVIQEDEWCISTGVERAIAVNRQNCQATIQHLSRPRPQAAKISAALHTIARCIRSKEAAIRFIERMLSLAGQVPPCPIASHLIATVTEMLAQRWLESDADTCASLISSWFCRPRAVLLQQLCGSLLPRRCAASARLYNALLNASLPCRNVFSHVSKFDLSRWSETGAVKQTVEAILKHVQGYGFEPDEEQLMLLELLGNHIQTLVSLDPLCLYAVCLQCSRLGVRGSLTPQLLVHAAVSARDVRGLRFDDLGHHLRDLGAIWWEARTNCTSELQPYYAAYSVHFAELLSALQIKLVEAAIALSYAEPRVALVSWSSLVDSWSPWVSPFITPMLLPYIGDDEKYSMMVDKFVHNIRMVMEMCKGTAPYLLRHTFDWVVSTHATAPPSASGQERVCLLAKLATLPWQAQWMDDARLRLALQLASTEDEALKRWACASWRRAAAGGWRRAGPLDALLCLFTHLPHCDETYAEAALLPWWEVDEATLEAAWDRFLQKYYNPSQAYCELPQYKILLQASELLPNTNKSSNCHNKRVLAITRLTRAAVDEALGAHVVAHTDCVLALITDLASQIEESEEEIEELLRRAVVILCVEPAATASLPVWQEWVESAAPRVVAGCVRACDVITQRAHFAGLAESALRAHLAHGTTGWAEIVSRLKQCHWSLSDMNVSTHPHATLALATLRSDGHRAVFRQLANSSLKFSENEAIIATWACLCCRSALRRDAGECGAAAVLRAWAEEPRNLLMKMVTGGGASVTPKQRLLCRLALCILTPNDENLIKAYEAACKAVLGSNPGDALHWGAQPEPKRLPRLAMRLYPNQEVYFQYELDMAEEEG